jgi:hypothetical protein
MNAQLATRRTLRRFTRILVLFGLAALGLMLLGVLLIAAKEHSPRATSMAFAVLFSGVVSIVIRLAIAALRLAGEIATIVRRVI